MKIKMTVIIETDNFEYIPQLVREFNQAIESETDNGSLIKRDNDRITWNTEIRA